MIGLQYVRGICQEGCFTTAVEMKMIGDFRPVGYRFCCPSHSFRRILSRGRNVPITFFARNSTLEVILYFRWVVLTPDAEDATYLNSTQLAEVYKQSDADNGVDMQLLELPYEPLIGANIVGDKDGRKSLKKIPRVKTKDLLRFLVVLTPDAEDATYLNSTQLAEVYKQSDADNGVDMQLLELPYEPLIGANIVGDKDGRKSLKKIPRVKIAHDDPGYIGEYGSNGESYEDYSVYS
ncbi:unnamed protein product [Strongylus vulgaris]|uniref:Uncharacterized protein n=1 Tax=Strongylus vulgaris TaxID=40348 RepID=A0A3P7JIL1_STRVU|nr:unnamed protein product [Strongylus vulgaris]